MRLKITNNYSPNFSIPKRKIKMIKFIVIHYTGMKSENGAIKRLCDESKSVSGNSNIPGYTRLDLRYGWRPTKQLDMSLLLTNMLDDAHTEARDATKINTGINRGAMFKVTYTLDQ